MEKAKLQIITEIAGKNQGLLKDIEEGDHGLTRLVENIYEAKSHFIYELIQNAEDVDARRCEIQLQPDRLVFRHDGRPFTADDIRGITRISAGTKIDDSATIGEKGVGFKAAFRYSDSPRIHSGGFHFEIVDLIIPSPVDPIESGSAAWTTVMEFPLTARREPQEVLYREISEFLRSDLDTSVILFLREVASVTWSISDAGIAGSVSRIASGNDPSLLTLNRMSGSNVEESSHFLLYTRPARSDSDLHAGVALKVELDEDDSTTINRVVPCDKGRLHVFLPTRVDTRLLFHINGPFRATVTREHLAKDDKLNARIMTTIGDALVDALEGLRLRGLLNVEALAVLPSYHSRVEDTVDELVQQLYTRMRTESLVPTSSGDFAPANDLVRMNEKAEGALGASGIEFFSRGKRHGAVAFCRDNREAHRVLKSLEVPDWDWAFFSSEMVVRFADTLSDDTRAWLDSRTAGAHWQLYAFLGELIEQPQGRPLRAEARRLRVVRTENGDLFPGHMVRHRPEDHEEAKECSSPFLDSTGWNDLKPQQQTMAMRFLDAAGVHAVGSGDGIRVILDRFYTGGAASKPGLAEHLEHMKIFVQHLHEGGNPSMLTGRAIFLSRDDRRYHPASEIYIDSPIEATGLSAIAEINTKRFPRRISLHSCYEPIRGVADLAEQLGALRRLTPVRVPVANNPGGEALCKANRFVGKKRRVKTMIDRDYTIQGLADLLAARDVDVSRLVWQSMARVKAEHLVAEYSPNRSETPERCPSQLVHILRDSPWVPDANDEFRRPCELSPDRLQAGFVVNNDNGWLDAVEFRSESIPDDTATEILMATVQQFPADVRRTLLQSSDDPEFLRVIQDFESRKRTAADPNSAHQVAPPTRSRKVTLNELQELGAHNWPVIPHDSRSVDPSSVLRQLYTDSATGRMLCQCCKGKPLPFVDREGRPYFIPVPIYDRDRPYWASWLALCPNHSALFHEHLLTDHSSMHDLAIKIRDGWDCTVQLRLAGEAVEIWFYKSHVDALRDELSLLMPAPARPMTSYIDDSHPEAR